MFCADVDFESLLRDVVTHGGAFAPRAFSDEYLDYLLSEVNSLDYGEYCSQSDDPVYEKHRDFRARVYATEAKIPRLTHLVEQIGWQIRTASLVGVNNHLFYPDDINVWRYNDKACAIGKHRDYSHDLFLIVGVTLTGYCTLEFYGDNKENHSKQTFQEKNRFTQSGVA